MTRAGAGGVVLLRAATVKALELRTKTSMDSGRAEGLRQALSALARSATEDRDYRASLRREALRLASQIVGVALDDHTAVRASAADALSLLRRPRAILLRAHPDDVTALTAWVRAVSTELLAEDAKVEILGDVTVSRGDIVAESEHGSVATTVGVRLATLISQSERED